MDDEVHIASFIVHHRPEALPALEALADTMSGLDIAVRDTGRLILLHESAGTRDLLGCIDAVQAVPGVISVNLVYHHAEPASALEQSAAQPA